MFYRNHHLFSLSKFGRGAHAARTDRKEGRSNFEIEFISDIACVWVYFCFGHKPLKPNRKRTNEKKNHFFRVPHSQLFEVPSSQCLTGQVEMTKLSRILWFLFSEFRLNAHQFPAIRRSVTHNRNPLPKCYRTFAITKLNEFTAITMRRGTSEKKMCGKYDGHNRYPGVTV